MSKNKNIFSIVNKIKKGSKNADDYYHSFICKKK